MTRTTALVVPLLFAAVAAVAYGAYRLLEADRAHLIAQFGGERLQQVEETASVITHELDDIPEDLRFAAELVTTSGSDADHRRELRALLQVVNQYKAVAIHRDAPAADIYLIEASADVEVGSNEVRELMRQTAIRALRRPLGELETSPSTAKEGWLRAFATPLPDVDGMNRRAIVVLVDLEPYFAALRLSTQDPGARVLLLGAHGRAAPLSDRGLARWSESGGDHPALSRMRRGERGVLPLSEEDARSIGLSADAGEHLIAFAPVHPRGGAHWSLAIVSSDAAIQSVQRAVAVRLTVAALVIALLLIAFGSWVVVASRRAVALRESQRHASRLAHLHEKAQKILDHIPTAVLALSADGRVAAANQALRERAAETAPGTPLSAVLPRAPQPSVERILGLVAQAVQTGKVRTLFGEELPLFGEPGHYTVHAVPLEHPDPDVRALLVIEDLSNVHALESQLLRAGKLATVGVLAAGIAHEVGTPLGIVRGRAEYLLGKLGDQSAHASGVQVIIDQIDRVSRTIRQLLDFSRIQPAQVRPVELWQATRAVEELVRLEAERRKIRLTVEVPPELPRVSADPDQLQQALVNLVINALDACGPGGRVRLQAEPAGAQAEGALGDRVTLRISDDGTGIPPELLSHVFDPFFTTKKRGQGTGLGLTIVAQIVRNHGGTVEMDSAPGRGTVVTLSWPRAQAEVRDASA